MLPEPASTDECLCVPTVCQVPLDIMWHAPHLRPEKRYECPHFTGEDRGSAKPRGCVFAITVGNSTGGRGLTAGCCLKSDAASRPWDRCGLLWCTKSCRYQHLTEDKGTRREIQSSCGRKVPTLGGMGRDGCCSQHPQWFHDLERLEGKPTEQPPSPGS